MVTQKSSIAFRRGIAMVELIFALVIMGIVLLSAPMLIQQSIRSGNVALQQEAIAAAASQTSVVLSMHWDESNANIAVGVSPLLDTNRAPFDFNVSSVPLGLVGVSGRNSEDNNLTLLPSAIGVLDANETTFVDFDDVDDYHNSNLGLVVFRNETTSSDIGDYVDVNLTMNTLINYTQDRPASGLLNATNMGNLINSTSIGAISNIKFIRVNLTSDSEVDELDKNISMEAFSSNIGTSVPEGEIEL